MVSGTGRKSPASGRPDVPPPREMGESQDGNPDDQRDDRYPEHLAAIGWIAVRDRQKRDSNGERDDNPAEHSVRPRQPRLEPLDEQRYAAGITSHRLAD